MISFFKQIFVYEEYYEKVEWQSYDHDKNKNRHDPVKDDYPVCEIITDIITISSRGRCVKSRLVELHVTTDRENPDVPNYKPNRQKQTKCTVYVSV